MLQRIYAIFRARNLEFLRDRGTLSWNLVLPIALMFGLSFIFSGERPEYTIGVLQSAKEINRSAHSFLQTRYIEFVAIESESIGIQKVARHQLDLLVSFDKPARYWVNPDSSKGYFVELALLQVEPEGSMNKSSIEGDAVRYVDWVLPGILAMNMMFSCLFGVGYVVVRYRKNGFLKRLRATPLRAIEFVIAQVASRLILIMTITLFVYVGTSFFLHTRMDGSYITLFIVALLGCITLISLGLLVAARVTSEELAGGLLNLATWPMMMLSGVWYSMESAPDWLQTFANIFPLTHILKAARLVMLDGATLLEIAPQLLLLSIMSTVFLTVAASVFRWRSN